MFLLKSVTSAQSTFMAYRVSKISLEAKKILYYFLIAKGSLGEMLREPTSRSYLIRIKFIFCLLLLSRLTLLLEATMIC